MVKKQHGEGQISPGGAPRSAGLTPMNAEHARLLAEVQALAKPIPPDWPTTDSYGGSGHRFYRVDVPTRRAMVRRWLARHKAWSPAEILTVVDSLTAGESHEEKTLGMLLLRASAKAFGAAGPGDVDRWLADLNGWAEVDSLCQNLFPAPQLLADWPAWDGLLERLSTDANINKRRAALVLLTGPVHYSDDARLTKRALINIHRLKAERDILITKAVSWLMRSMAARHRAAVERLLAEDDGGLPKVAVRETRIKLATGTKSGRTRSRAGVA
jgi:3-methyladenine DNA glycosylase AlkD